MSGIDEKICEYMIIQENTGNNVFSTEKNSVLISNLINKFSLFCQHSGCLLACLSTICL